MQVFSVENIGSVIVEMDVHTLAQTTSRYLEPGKTGNIDAARQVIIRVAEGGEGKLNLQNPASNLRLDLYLISPAKTDRLSSLAPGKTRKLELVEDTELLVLPVGEHANSPQQGVHHDS